jgi:hypothetical protein
MSVNDANELIGRPVSMLNKDDLKDIRNKYNKQNFVLGNETPLYESSTMQMGSTLSKFYETK